MILTFFVENRNYLIWLFTVGYLSTFTINAFLHGNFEFLYYAVVMTILIYLTIVIHRQIQLGFLHILNLSLLGFLHLLGGNLVIGATRLYDYFLIAGIFRYDNFVHLFGTFTVTFILYSLVAPYIDEQLRRRQYALFAIGLVLMAIGVGTINELVEFFAVIFLGAAEEVGGYYNNSLDLFYNTLGSIVACVIIYFYREELVTRKKDRLERTTTR